MKNLRFSYILALGLIALVILVSQILVQSAISSTLYDAKTINVSGEQSTESQRIAKEVLALERANDEETFKKHKTNLKEATTKWERYHNALLYGDELLELDEVKNTESTETYFQELEPRFNAIRTAIIEVNKIEFDTEYRRLQIADQANIILENETAFLEIMRQITNDYEGESRSRITSLSRIEYILAAIILVMLLVIGFYIFRPVIVKINNYTKRLLKQERSLKKALFLQKEEKAKVDYLNRQAESVFQTVQQGIFLLNEKFVISDLYSSVTEDVIDEKDLGGTNFLQLMKSKLVKRDQEALEMFVKHLFNSDIEEDILSQLNPLDHVQIFTNNAGADIESKHISVSFTRIKDHKKIFAVLVTITDETEAVIMQQKISESEEKNKTESEQLLSILRVDPIALRQFLDSTQEGLNEISVRYETDKETNPKELITFTFNIIHNLKGNAGILDLELIVAKLHEIEEIIVELRHKEDLHGNDFLKILYEINDLSTTVINMQRMLLKIADVNKKISTGQIETKNSNEALILSLNKGLEKLSKEIGKETRFIFNDNDISIPEKYKVPIKDMSLQMFRNSLIHGIETSEEREKLGKPLQAKISLEIKQSDNDLIISYKDDGRGLSEEVIKRKAVEANLYSVEEFEKLDKKSVAEIIFSDGFSTAKEVDKNAGRGQGMNMIKDQILKYNGRYELNYEEGVNFNIEYSLPVEPVATLSEV